MGKSKGRNPGREYGKRPTREGYGKRPSNLAKDPRNRWVVTCPSCGKHGFGSRADAKAAARDLWPGDPMSVYRCGDYYHYGHNERKYQV